MEMITRASSQAEGGQENNSSIITTKDIIERNIKTDKKIPNPVKCKFCGKLLYYEAILFMGTVVTIRNKPQRCDCEKAKAYWKQYDELEKEKNKQAEIEQLKGDYEKRLNRSNLSLRHRDCSFKNFKAVTPEQKKALSQAYNYAKDFDSQYKSGRGLYIEGTYGTGKTHLVAAISMYVMKRGKQVYCQTENAIYESVRATYDTHGESDKAVLERYKKVPLLVIDDLGKDKCTDWSLQVLYAIINSRYENMKPVIITTNYNEDELIKRLTVDGDSRNIKAIISRLRETTDLITMAWVDYRGGEYKK